VDALTFFAVVEWGEEGWGVLVGSYLLGAIPFGLVVARLLHGTDPREVGSGNIGATNTMRALGRGWGLLVFAFDFLKGWIPAALIAPAVLAEGPDALALQVSCGLAAVVGHCFPIYLGFKGGKGVATGSGVMIALEPRAFLAGGLVWLVALAGLRFVSLASILMGVTFALAAYWLRPDASALALGTAALALIFLVRHRANIARLIAGTEPRIGQHANASGTETSDG
jgi:glycerol-3-phosphate acyltransferase PlsY